MRTQFWVAQRPTAARSQHESSLSSSHSAAAGGGVFVASMPQHVVVQRERTQESACAHKPLSLALSHCDAPPAAESGAQFAMLVHRRAACGVQDEEDPRRTARTRWFLL